MVRALVAVTTLTLATASVAAADDVRVRIPQGVTYADSTTTPGPDGRDYVTVTGLVFPNPSGVAQTYTASQFHLVVGGTPYLPVVRPHLGAIDKIEPGIVGPHEALKLSVTFLVPGGTHTGDVEFTPHWVDDVSGRTIDYCCLYI